MRVSVIIPVYNAESFLASAVASALAQPETAEVLLVDDGSTDNSHGVCQQLAQDPRVHVLSHPGKQNLGVSASRNLGIRNATMPFIAFLDADDMYERGRFEVTSQIFNAHPDADGVHEMIGVLYENSALKEQHIQRASGENTGLRIPVAPENLFHTLAIGKHGHIHLNGLTLRRPVPDQHAILFDSDLIMSEDMDFILRLSAVCKLYAGDVTRIVAQRRVHDKNSVFLNPSMMKYRKHYLEKCIVQNFYGSKDLIAQLHILTRRVGAGSFFAPFRGVGKLALPIKLIGIAGYLISRPGVLWHVLSSGRRKSQSVKRTD